MCQLLFSSFPGERQNEKLFFICFVCLCEVQLVSRLFSSFVFLLNLSLSVAHVVVQPWRPVAIRREGLEGETAFFIWRKSKRIVRHLNSFSTLKFLLYNRKLDFHFQHYLLKIFSWLPLRVKLCGSLVEITNEGSVWLNRTICGWLFFSQGLLLTFSFDGSNNQLVSYWDQCPPVPGAGILSLKELPRCGSLPNTVSLWHVNYFLNFASQLIFFGPHRTNWLWSPC